MVYFKIGFIQRLFILLVPRPPSSAVAGDYWIRVRPSVRLSTIQVGFYSATELKNYWAELNQTFCYEKIYIEVVHLGIGFVVLLILGSYNLVKNEEFQHNETNNEGIFIEVVQAMKRPSN